MFNNEPGVARGVRILTMVIARSGTFNDQFRRPYQTQATGDTVNAIQERFDQVQGHIKSITPGLFDGIASSFVSPQATPSSGIIIPNGWGTERYFYILKVAVYNSLGGEAIDVIQGYSDFFDPTYNGLIDPRTRFTINSITRMVNTRQITNYGAQTVGMVKNSYHVVANNNYNGVQDFAQGSLADAQVTMRPADVYSALHSSHYTSHHDLMDMRTANVQAPRTSKRSNAVSAQYTGEIVRGYADAVNQSMLTPGGEHLYGQAIGSVADEPLSKDEFVKAISNVTNVPLANTFQLSDLYRLDPQLESPMDQRIKIQRDQMMVPTYRTMQHQAMRGIPSAGEANHWRGTDHETHAATVLANGLPALMVEVGLIHLVFQATNHSIQPIVETRWASGIAENYDCRPIVPMLERRIQRELIDQLTFNGQMAYQIYVDVRIAQHTEISVQFESRPVMEYISPTFADSLMSPVLTTDRNRLSELSEDFGTLVQHLVQVQQPTLEDLDPYSNI